MGLSMENLDELAKSLEQLKVDYEAYFQGIARTPPEKDFLSIQRNIRKYKEEFIVNTAIKFRLATLVSKFQSYQRYWGRIMKEIEEGRYFRDKFKADLHMGKIKVSQAELEKQMQAKEAGPAAGAQQPAGQKPAKAAATDDAFNSLHKEYMIARLECNQSIEGLTKEQLKQSITKSMPTLQKQFPGKKIEFKVVIENGKAKLKAIPK